MKKNPKVKKEKNSRKQSAAEPPLPTLVEAMAKLVERLESVERKMEQVLGRVSSLPAELRNAVNQNQRPQASHSFQNTSPQSPLSARFDQASTEGRRERVLYQAVCADCQKNCEVPFKPAGRPVYCKECFAIRKAGHTPQDPQSRSNPPSPERKAAYMPKPMEYVPLPGTIKPAAGLSKKIKPKPGKSKKKRK